MWRDRPGSQREPIMIGESNRGSHGCENSALPLSNSAIIFFISSGCSYRCISLPTAGCLPGWGHRCRKVHVIWFWLYLTCYHCISPATAGCLPGWGRRCRKAHIIWVWHFVFMSWCPFYHQPSSFLPGLGLAPSCAGLQLCTSTASEPFSATLV